MSLPGNGRIWNIIAAVAAIYGLMLGTAPAGAVEDTQPASSSSLKTTSLIVPGSSLGKIHLGFSKLDVLKTLGKPTDISDRIWTYWSGDRKNFVTIRFSDGNTNEIAFSSPAFTTATGIRLSNYETFSQRFSTREEKDGWGTYVLETGGFAVAVPKDGSPIGIISKSAKHPTEFDWLPSLTPSPETVASTQSKTEASGSTGAVSNSANR